MPARSASTSVPLAWMSRPSMRMPPLSISSRRLRVRIRVDLPEPEGPQTTTTSFFSTRSLTSTRAWYLAGPVP